MEQKQQARSVKECMPLGIKRRMHELKIRVPALANKIDVPATTLYNVLGGRSEPALLLAVKIAAGLEMPLEDFISEFYPHDVLAQIGQFGKLKSADGEKGCDYFLPRAS